MSALQGGPPFKTRSLLSASLPIARARIGLGAMVVLGVVVNLSNVPGLLAFLPNAIVGSLLVIRRPGNPIGWLLLLMAAGFSIVGRPIEVVAWAIATGNTAWLPLLAWLGTMTAIGLFAGLASLSAVFPSGALPKGGIGRMTRAALALIAGVALLQALDPAFSVLLPDGTTVVIRNPIGLAPEWPGWSFLDGPAYMVALGGIVVCTAGLLVRFRGAGAVERQQDKWLLASLALVAVAVTFGFAAGVLVDSEAGWIWIPAVFAFPLPPVAIGVAILRYRLYEIDRLISRTISWALVTGVLVAAFAGAVVALQAVLAGFTQGETLAVAASTLVVFALFQPLRRHVQSTIDRHFYRGRYDAQQTADGFAERLRNEVDLGRLRVALIATADDAVRPVAATVWLRGGTRVAR